MTDVMDEDAFGDEDGTGQLSLTDLYNKLLEDNELIVTVPIEEEQRVRRGLAVIKAKQNRKLKDAGIPVDDSSFSFHVTPSTEHANAVAIHIVLAKKTTITVLGLKKPDNEL